MTGLLDWCGMTGLLDWCGMTGLLLAQVFEVALDFSPQNGAGDLKLPLLLLHTPVVASGVL